MPILVLKPEPDCSALVARLRARGVDAIAAPCLRFENLPAPDLDRFRSAPADVLLTSPRGLDALPPLDPQWRLLALAPKTAALARSAGLRVDEEVEGGAAALAARARPGVVLVLTSDLGGDEALRVRPDAIVVPTYRTLPVESLPAFDRPYSLYAASPSALRVFDALVPGGVAGAERVYARGATTLAEAQRLGAPLALDADP